ncbi:hypothetical protein EHS13_32725 [Paenibacillus psychroresistens]|uniref:SLH domain-containing protein n=1 Tax=Paenibacillus psychroresistens TaxID=1778678 RepID=A0A6B8RS89_9BACL|nr:GLUG motif-containing protein [Paenibacillus psychroresistens]QGQ99291.1 hypothetical protein EHS13_32725 [Paenibacillus psychroresistens]
MRIKFKKGISIILVMLMVVGGLNGLFVGGGKVHAAVSVEFAGGTGAQSDPYLIEKADQLNGIRSNLAANYKLTADIELGEYDWAPIGAYMNGFNGNLDGNGFKIMNLTLDTPADDSVGLFRYTGPQSFITNIILENVNIKGIGTIGAIAGINTGTISSSSVTGNVYSDPTPDSNPNKGNNIGGLVGMNSGDIISSFSTANVTGIGYVGGVVGFNNEGTISDSYALGNVVGSNQVGGLVGGDGGGEISNSYATGSVTGNDDVGGLVGYSGWSSSISNSYASGNVVGSTDVGGLVGKNAEYNGTSGEISNSFYNKNTTQQEDEDKGDGLSTGQMLLQGTYANVGWDINDADSHWYMVSGQYPQLWAGISLAPGTDSGTTKLNNVVAEMEYTLDGDNYISVMENTYGSIPVNADDEITVRLTETPTSTKTLAVVLSNIKPAAAPQTAVLAMGTGAFGTTDLTGVESGMEYRVNSDEYSDVTGTLQDIISIAVEEGDIIYVRIKGTDSQPASSVKVLLATSANIKTTVITGEDIFGVTPPVKFATPESSIAATDEYTASLAWSPNDTTFIGGETYTATITLMPKSGYSLTTVAANFFKVEGAATTNAANSGIITAVFPAVASDFAGGTGSVNNPYQIKDAVQLDKVRNYLNSSFELIADIELDGYGDDENGWMPIGDSNWYGNFNGNFDGKGFIINHLTINRPISDYLGLFAVINVVSTITDMKLENVDITGRNQVGGLAGANYGTISDSYVKGNVYGNSEVGGLTGFNYNNIDNSYASVTLEGSSNHLGGLVGNNYGEINNSNAAGTVVGEGYYVGGLVGNNDGDGDVNSSYAAVSVTGQGTLGGLVGSNGGEIDRSYATGKVIGLETDGSANGGLVGNNSSGSISNSFATGNVSGADGTENGGLVGSNVYGQVDTSYATGDVNGEESNNGGLAGNNYDGDINNSYAKGSVFGDNSQNGGLVGSNETGIINSSYAQGSVTGANSTNGGLVGKNDDGSVSNTYAKGSVTGANSINGGLVGRNPYGNITNSYAIGNVAGTNSANGGLVGINNDEEDSDGSITGSFYNTETTGQDDEGKGSGQITEDMMDQELYFNDDSDSAWDFTELWGLNSTRNGGYPHLQVVQTYVDYDRNDSEDGNVPIDEQSYMPGSKVSVAGNSGILVKTGYAFAGWNTEMDGTGENYVESETFTILGNTTLYAKWLESNKEALNSAILLAVGIKESAVVGTLVGQYTDSAKTALGTAISLATAVKNDTNANQATIDSAVIALDNAVSGFKATAVQVPSKTALNSAITAATNTKMSAVIGTLAGQYTNSAVTALGTAISLATAVKMDTTANQATVDAAVAALNTAVSDFEATAVSVSNKVALNSAITAATAIKTLAVVGTQVGQYTNSAITALGTAITLATAVKMDPTAIQATVDAAVTTLNTAVSDFEATAVSASNKVALINAIESATTIKTSAVVGTQVGQYTAVAIATLGTAITNATAVKNDTTANQATVDAEVTALNTAVTTFVETAVPAPSNPTVTPPASTTSPTPTSTPAPTPSAAPTAQPTDVVEVDSSANVVKTVTGSNGHVTTTVTQDAAKLADAFKQMASQDDKTGKAPSVTITADNVTGTGVVFNLPSSVLADAALKTPNAVIDFKSADGGYSLPITILDFAAIARSLGTDIKNINIQVTITTVDTDTNTKINARTQNTTTKQLGNAIEFTVTATGNGKTFELNNFGATYVERNVVVKSTVDHSHATVALYDPATGQFSFVPAVFETQADKSTKVTFKRNGNSIYTVLSSTKTFDDVTNHWAKSDIELLASKLVVNGVTDSSFAPNNNITRAEFAALLVRSLGLTLDASSAVFTDVKSSDWYAGAIGAAVKAKLVDGFEDHSFKPNATITREQMAVMVTRAITAAGKTSDVTGKQSEILAKFQDNSLISTWAQVAVAQSVEANIISGMTGNTFVPSANATRAQAVVMLKRLLEYTDFIN